VATEGFASQLERVAVHAKETLADLGYPWALVGGFRTGGATIRSRRRFRYRWGVGEHTDYGLLTILLQDDAGGAGGAVAVGMAAAPPVPGSFFCNTGDMLDHMTHGVFRSTPHHVRNPALRDRLSYLFFFILPFSRGCSRSTYRAWRLRPTNRRIAGIRPTSMAFFQGTYKVFPKPRQATLQEVAMSECQNE